MKGWQIFAHSVRQVFGNLGGALRVSGVLFALQVLVLFLAGKFFAAAVYGRPSFLGTIVGSLAVTLVACLIGIWIAVGWHRFILLTEMPDVVPKMRLDRVVGYWGTSVLIGLIVSVAGLCAMWMVNAVPWRAWLPLGDPLSPSVRIMLLVLFCIIVIIPLGAFALRLATVLPGVALQGGLQVTDGWDATKGEVWTFLALTTFAVVGTVLMGVPKDFIASYFGSVLAGQAYGVIMLWVQTMIGVSVLTTLYGHYIEKRPLDQVCFSTSSKLA